MRHLLPALAACAALFPATWATAGPGCGGKSHDVTASTSQPAAAPDRTSIVAEATEPGSQPPFIDLLAFNTQLTTPEITMLPDAAR